MAETPSHGPDQLIPSNDYITNMAEGAVKIRAYEPKILFDSPLSIPTLMKNTVSKYPRRVALAEKVRGKWVKISFKKYHKLVLACAKAFIKLGLQRYHSVCVIGFNSPEWMISCLGAIHAGGFACGIYATNTAELTQVCINESRGTIAVLEDEDQVLKLKSVIDKVPGLLKIIQYKGTPVEEDVLSWKELIDMGKNEPDTELLDRLKRIAINQCAQIVFTSSTTGLPKAVMLSHDNILSCSYIVGGYMKIKKHETIISYLPLSHVAAAAVDVFLTLTYGGTVCFALKDAFKGSLGKTLKEVQPTRFLAVPRIYEKMYEKLTEASLELPRFMQNIFDWSSSVILKENMCKINGLHSDVNRFKVLLARKLLFSIKAKLGFKRCKSWICAAAPISIEILKYFLSLDIPIATAYGLTETTGAHTLNLDFKYGSVGKPCPGLYIDFRKIERSGEGEILLNGRDICMGYLGTEDLNQDAFNENGWLYTGDIGKLDHQGFLYLTGRAKEIIITAGGENVAPVPIEERIKAELPIVNYSIVIGDKEKFLSTLLTIKRKMDAVSGLPSSELDEKVITWCKNLGSTATTIHDILTPDPLVEQAVYEAIERANLSSLSSAQIIQKFKILPTDFTIQTGELGPTMKLKRVEICQKYHLYIDEIYGRLRASNTLS